MKMKTSINGSDDEISSQLISNKPLNTTNAENNDLSKPMNGWTFDGINHNKESVKSNEESKESKTGIRLLCEAANVVEKNAVKCKQQLNGLLTDRIGSQNCDCISPNICRTSCTPHSTHTTSNTYTTSSSVCSYTCCTSTSTSNKLINSCDINNKESLLHPIAANNEDIKCLRDLLESDLNINSNNFHINNSNNSNNNNENNIELINRIVYVNYESERQMPDIMRLIQKDLSEPYSIYTYRYFIHNWPHLCFLAMDNEKCVGAIVCKLDLHKKMVKRGYIAMLAVDENYRKMKIGSNLVLRAIQAMVGGDADEVVLETEVTNKPALQLYENLGFVRDKRLFRYYLNGVDALRLKLWLK